METQEWEVATHDVWGNEKDGWEVNDTFRQGSVSLAPDATDADVVSVLRSGGYLKAGVKYTQFDVDGDDYSIYVNAKKDGYPMFTLTREDSE